jgi:hypothetical protein
VSLLALSFLGCATLDGFVFNPVHCSTVGPETCEADNAWDGICAPCEEPYDWARDYPWMEGTLGPGESVRPVDEARIEPLTFPTDDGEAELDAYFLSAHGDDPEAARVTVVYHHGNYAGIEHYLPRVRFLHEAGYNVLVWDYRGYGKSEPAVTPTPEQHLADGRLVLARALELAPDPERVVAYGYSLGAITASEMAVSGEICALLLEAPFTSLSEIAHDNTTLSMGEQFFSAGLFDNFERMEVFEGPALGLSGTEDDWMPLEVVTELVQTGPGPREVWAVEGARHGISDGGVPEAGLAEYRARIREFLAAQGCL